jgi:hypothetical protein
MQTSPFDPFQAARIAPEKQDPVLSHFSEWRSAADKCAAGNDEGAWGEEMALRRAMAARASTAEGIATRLEMALQYADFDPNGVDPEDLPWSLILLAIDELRSGKVGGGE